MTIPTADTRVSSAERIGIIAGNKKATGWMVATLNRKGNGA